MVGSFLTIQYIEDQEQLKLVAFFGGGGIEPFKIVRDLFSYIMAISFMTAREIITFFLKFR